MTPSTTETGGRKHQVGREASQPCRGQGQAEGGEGQAGEAPERVRGEAGHQGGAQEEGGAHRTEARPGRKACQWPCWGEGPLGAECQGTGGETLFGHSNHCCLSLFVATREGYGVPCG